MSHAPPSPGRRLPSLFIAAFVGIQLFLPLHAYWPSTDRYDERFAWRMFSATSLVQCTGSFAVDQVPVDMSRTFHRIWLTRFRHGRQGSLTARMAAHLCAANPGSEVRLQRVCREVDGMDIVLEDGTTDLCAAGSPR